MTIEKLFGAISQDKSKPVDPAKQFKIADSSST